MKKISLAVIAAALSMTSAVKADDNFSGFRGSLLGDWGFVTVTDAGGVTPASAAGVTPVVAAVDRVVDNNGLGKIGVNLGYTKVMANNMLVGAGVIGFMDMFKIEGKPDDAAKPENNKAQLKDGVKLDSGFGGGLNLSLGMVFSPKIAGRVIGEVTYAKQNLTPKASGTVASEWVMGAAAGAAIDFAATDRFILTVGGKYNFLPTEVKWTAANNKDNKDLVDGTTFTDSKSWNIFAEVGFRITQN